MELTRKQIRVFRRLARQALGIKACRSETVTLKSDASGRFLAAASDTVVLEQHLGGGSQGATIDAVTIPLCDFNDCEANTEAPVSITKSGQHITLAWYDSGIPKSTCAVVWEPLFQAKLFAIDRAK